MEAAVSQGKGTVLSWILQKVDRVPKGIELSHISVPGEA